MFAIDINSSSSIREGLICLLVSILYVSAVDKTKLSGFVYDGNVISEYCCAMRQNCFVMLFDQEIVYS